MTQMGFSAMEFAAKKKRARRERFLEQNETATPWALLVGLIEPHYPKGERGRPPSGIERMLRMYIVQQCFGFADEATEDALYDSQSIRNFVGVDLSRQDAPYATTLLNVSAPAREARTDPGNLRGDQWSHGGTGSVAQGGHDCGCHDHCGTAFDQEPSEGVGP